MFISRFVVYFCLNFLCLSAHAQWLPFTLKNNHITFDIEFNGHPARAILDSGAAMNAVSEYYVEKYPEGITRTGRVVVKGINSSQKTSLYNRVPITLFGTDLVFDKLIGINIPGAAILLGAPFFQKFIVQIDFPNSRMQLFPKNSIDMDKFKNVNVKRQRGTLLPAIEVEVNLEKIWLTLDTGNNGGLFVQRSYAVENNWITGNINQGKAIGVNEIADIDSFTIDSLKIGPYLLEQVLVSIPADGQSSHIGRSQSTSRKIKRGKPTKGILGYDVLKHFIVTIDYFDYKVHIVAP